MKLHQLLETEEVSLEDFYNLLAGHDWWHEMSDDHNVWKRGSANLARLNSIAAQSPDHKDLMHQYADHVFNRGQKPPRP